MEQYLVSARLFRPNSFGKVVGQQHVTNTLKNALLNKCLAQVFLFCGPRGVGKTTCARILAKAINCEELTKDGEPCNRCQACLRSQERDSGSVFELDGASNNSVDDIRLLVEQIRYVPQVDKYKVYIIDEVHMLSTSAFNAFLKTLEEPPKHAVFILATTEKQKIIPTILSRCQVFDFRRVKTSDIIEHLAHVAHLRGVNSEKEALFILAEKADGSIRDALSTFDMVSSFELSGDITYRGVIENLHIIDDQVFFELIENIINAEVEKGFLQLKNLVESGFEWQSFVTGLNKHLRNLLVCKYDATYTGLLETTESKVNAYRAQAAAVSLEFLFDAIQKVTQCELNYKLSYNKQVLVELMLLELSQLGAGKFLLKKKAEARGSEDGAGIEQKKDVAKNFDDEKFLKKDEQKKFIEKTEEKFLDQNDFLEKKKAEALKEKSEEPNQLRKEKFPTIKIPKLTAVRHQAKPAIDASTATDAADADDGSGAVAIGFTEKKSIETASDYADTHSTTHDRGSNLEFAKVSAIVWDYAQQFKAALGIVKYNILMNSELSVERDEIRLLLTNPVELDLLDEMKADLMRVLKEKLSGTMDLKIVGRLGELPSERKPYTKEEKLSFMEEKYPIVNKLVERLSLALDGEVM